MDQNNEQNTYYLQIISVCLVMISAVIITVAFAKLKSVLVPITMAFFLYNMLLPIKNYLDKKAYIPNAASIFMTSVIALFFTIGLGAFITNSIRNMGKGMRLYEDKVQKLLDSNSLGFLDGFKNFNIESSSNIINVIETISKEAMNLAGNFTLIFIFLIFFLIGSERGASKSNSLISEVKQSISNYIWIKFAISFGTAVVVGFFLTFIKLEMAITFAFMIFLLNFIPNLGSIIATLIPLPIAYLQFGMGIEFAMVLIVPGIIQLVVGNILEPRFMGNSLGLHPITVLFFLIFWGIVWGPMGMFLAVPLTSVLKIISSKIKGLGFLAHLLEGELSKLQPTRQ